MLSLIFETRAAMFARLPTCTDDGIWAEDAGGTTSRTPPHYAPFFARYYDSHRLVR